MKHRQQAAPSGEPDDRRPLTEVGVALLVTLLGFALYLAYSVVLFVLAFSLWSGELSEVQLSVLDPLALALGLGTAGLIYFAQSRHGPSFLDVRLPSLVGLGYTVAAVVVILGVSYVSEFVIDYFGIPAPQHSTTEMLATADPTIVLYFVVASLLFIGPAEELLFRNLLQKRLAETFSPAGAIGISSAIFAVAHTAAYLTGHTGQLFVSLATVFVLSLVLGYVYHRTENLVVVALAHGGYDAVLFLSIYAERVGVLGGVGG